MYKLSYEKCVCFIFLVILVFLSCSGFHTDRLVTLTDHNNNKKYPFTSSYSIHENAQHDYNDFITRMINTNRAADTNNHHHHHNNNNKKLFARAVHFAGVVDPSLAEGVVGHHQQQEQQHHHHRYYYEPPQRRNRRLHIRWPYERRRKRRDALLHSTYTLRPDDRNSINNNETKQPRHPMSSSATSSAHHQHDETTDLVRTRRAISQTTADDRRKTNNNNQNNNKNNNGDKFCPGQDIATRAYYAKIIIQGRVRSKLNTNVTTKYGVTVEVKKIHKNESNFGANITEMLRLHFAVGKRRGCENKLVHGLVRADLENGKDYIFFLESVGMHNYTVIGPPVPYNNKKVQKIREVVNKKRLRQARIFKQPMDQKVKRYRSFQLNCTVRGFPPPIITWYKDNRKIYNKPKKQRIKYKKNESTLTVQRADLSDTGEYQCRAQGVIGKVASSSATVSIPDTLAHDTEGQKCNAPQRDSFCLNGGTCVYYTLIGEYSCRCESGYIGNRCENKDVSSKSSMYMLTSCSNSYYC